MSTSKLRAIALRRQGYSLTHIHKVLTIPKSTLSGWFKEVVLTTEQKKKLRNNSLISLQSARTKASKWHRAEKEKRLEKARKDALEVLSNIDLKNINQLELNLAILYLAEGSKKNTETALGSSDPQTLQFFLRAMEKVFHYDRNLARYELYIRADQNGPDLIEFWSNTLKVKSDRFKQISIDKRSKGATYPEYKGVCSIRCGTVAIQRRLVYLAKAYFAILAK